MDNLKNTVFLDLETTGITDHDDVLEIAIIDSDGCTLINEQFDSDKPSWSKAEAVHGISKTDVEGKAQFCDSLDKVLDLCTNKDIVIYNAAFDTRFIDGILEVANSVQCCMLKFAEFYGDFNEKYKNFKWKSLQFAAEHTRYTWQQKAHSSLGDVLATRHIWHYMLEAQV